MGLLNDQKISDNFTRKVQVDDQTDSSTNLVSLTAEPNSEDMELNEEQLDIISGGNDSKILIKE